MEVLNLCAESTPMDTLVRAAPTIKQEKGYFFIEEALCNIKK